jgi:opacity protein-like surface antigen
MKKVTLSMIAALAMSTFAVAGGDIAPVEPVVETPVVEEVSTGAFYVGLAYGMVNTEISYTDGQDTLSLDIDHSTAMFQAGYQFNPYLAIEGRYWMAVGDADATLSLTGEGSESGDLDDDSNVWGIYIKPMYPVTSEFTVYALLGYGNVELDLEGASTDESDFQWGLGVAYAFNDNLSVFVDYVSLYDDSETFVFEREPITGDIEVDSWNFGITYKF